MIKDSYTLDRKAWHVKLMKYIWNLDASDFSHICPYFWLSILNVSIILPFAIFKVVFLYIFTRFAAYLDRVAEKWANEEFQKIQTFDHNAIEKVARMYICTDGYYDMSKKYRYLLDKMHENKVMSSNTRTDWWNKYQEVIEKLLTERENNKEFRKVKKQEVVLTRKQYITKILKWVKPVSVVLLWVFSILAAWFVGWLIYIGIKGLFHMPHNIWIGLGKAILKVLIIVPISIFIILLVSRVKSICTTKKVFTTIGKGIAWPFVTIFKLMKTITFLIVDIVSESCPAINWKD